MVMLTVVIMSMCMINANVCHGVIPMVVTMSTIQITLWSGFILSTIIIMHMLMTICMVNVHDAHMLIIIVIRIRMCIINAMYIYYICMTSHAMAYDRIVLFHFIFFTS